MGWNYHKFSRRDNKTILSAVYNRDTKEMVLSIRPSSRSVVSVSLMGVEQSTYDRLTVRRDGEQNVHNSESDD